jgi:hypothetical protein
MGYGYRRKIEGSQSYMMITSYQRMWGLLLGMALLALVVGLGAATVAQGGTVAVSNNAAVASNNTSDSNTSNNNSKNNTGTDKPSNNTTPVKPTPATRAGSQNPNRGRQGGNLNPNQVDWQHVADTLQLSLDQLGADLNNGQSLAQIATAQQVSIEQVKEAVLSNFKSQLDAQVQNGQMNQQQADTLYQRTVNRLDSALNQPLVGVNAGN